MGSGSSAVTDLLREFHGVSNRYGSFEYVFLHCPDGLFDLEDKLLVGGNALRCDEAIRAFLSRMKELYDKPFWWVGDYKHIVGQGFYARCEQLAQELVEGTSPCYWYMQERPNAAMVGKLILRRLVKVATFGRVQLKRPVRAKQTLLAYPTAEEFFAAARRFLSDILAMMNPEGEDLLLDQLLLPHNLHRVDRYFGDELRAVVVERDPRDVFLLNKYVWPGGEGCVIYATDPALFARQYRRLRALERPAPPGSAKVLRVRFEDLVFRYESTRESIVRFAGLENRPCPHEREYFNPAVSVKNTRLYTRPEYVAEVEIIARALPEYLYAGE